MRYQLPSPQRNAASPDGKFREHIVALISHSMCRSPVLRSHRPSRPGFRYTPPLCPRGDARRHKWRHAMGERMAEILQLLEPLVFPPERTSHPDNRVRIPARGAQPLSIRKVVMASATKLSNSSCSASLPTGKHTLYRPATRARNAARSARNSAASFPIVREVIFSDAEIAKSRPGHRQ